MNNSEIKKNTREFYSEMSNLVSDINTMFYNIALGLDYDEKHYKRLYRVYKFICGIDNNQEKSPD